MGAVGDSFTDEYSYWAPIFYGSSAARNWADLVGTHRSAEVNLGGYAAWSAPRFTGYEYNYARLGATTTTLLSEGQHTGIATQPVNLVFMGIGTNDFSALEYAPLLLVNKYGPIYNGTLDPVPLVNALVANFTTALDTIAGPPASPTGVKVVVGDVGDWGAASVYRVGRIHQSRAKSTGHSRGQFSQCTNRGDRARPRHAGGRYFRAIEPVTRPGAVIGGFTMTLGAAPSDNQAYFFGPDRIHPGTLWQGLLANTIIASANEQYGTNLTPFTDQELLSYAGIADPNGGTVTSHFAVDGYVLLPVPEPATLTLVVLAFLRCCPWGDASAGERGNPSVRLRGDRLGKVPRDHQLADAAGEIDRVSDRR